MDVPRQNPVKPALSVFLSYSMQDRASVISLIDGLRSANIEVLDFFDDEPLGAEINSWVETHIAQVDAVVVIISRNSLAHPTWIEREIGLAMRLLIFDGVLHPSIVPIRIGSFQEDEPLKFQPRDFHSAEPIGEPIVWRDINCMMPDRDGMDATVKRFVALFTPQTQIITHPEAPNQISLFDSAMRLYRKLLPIERERDQEVDIAHWLCESWDDNDRPALGIDWLSVLVVQHISGRAIGIFWCTVQRTTGIGFVSFWGVLTTHRLQGRAVDFLQEAVGVVRHIEPTILTLFFAAEQVDWRVLDRFLKNAKQMWKRATGKRPSAREWRQELTEPIDGQRSSLKLAVERASPRSREAVLEQLRRFRRFALYTNGANYNQTFERKGITLMAFTRKEFNSVLSESSDSPMVEFVQPPIRPPVAESNDSHLWLFALLFDGNTITPEKALHWIYDVFLKSTLGLGRCKLEGWNDYMADFKHRHFGAFILDAELRHLRLRDWFAPYNLLLLEVKKHWIRQQSLGITKGRWDLHL